MNRVLFSTAGTFALFAASFGNQQSTTSLKDVAAVVSHYANYPKNFRTNPRLVTDILSPKYSEPSDPNINQKSEQEGILAQANYKGRYANGPQTVLLRKIVESKNQLFVSYYMAGSWRMFDRADGRGDFAGLSFWYIKIDTWDKLADGSYQMVSAKNDPTEVAIDGIPSESQVKKFEALNKAILEKYKITVTR